MKDLIIREATEPDLHAIDKLAKELIRSVEDKEGLSEHAILKNCRVFLNLPDSYILMVEVSKESVGLIAFTTRTTILHNAPSALIEELIVLNNYQGKGVGKELMRAAIEKCKELGCCEIEVTTELTNSNARAFYKKCGFVERGVFLERDLL